MQQELNNIPQNVISLIHFADKNCYTVNEIIERLYFLKRQQQEQIVLPSTRKKPEFSSKFTSKEVKIYADELEAYEKSIKQRKLAEVKRRNCCNIDSLLEDFIKEKANFDAVPFKYQAKIYAIAWERGHSSGYAEVYYYLKELVEVFED